MSLRPGASFHFMRGVSAGFLALVLIFGSAAVAAESETENDVDDEARKADEAEEEESDAPKEESDSTIDDTKEERGWTIKGDLRPIVSYQDDSNRDGSSATDDSLGVRARLGVNFDEHLGRQHAASFLAPSEIDPGRGVEGSGDDVDHDVGEQHVFAVGALDVVAVGIGP